MKIIMGLLLLAAFAFGDDHGNSISSATPVGTSSSTRGNIEKSGDVDFFKIVLPSPGTLELYTTSSIDTYGYLFDSAGRLITLDDDRGSNYNFKIVRYEIPAGTYYVKVRHYSSSGTGSYIFRVHLSPYETSQDDYGNTINTARLIQQNSTTRGRIEKAGDVDYFKIVLTDPGTLSVNTTSSIDTYGYLQNSSGSLITLDDDRGEGYNFSISRHLRAGTYYVKVRHYYSYRTGSYTLNVAFNPDPPPSIDDHGNTMSSATLVEPNSVTQGRIEVMGDWDYFKIVLPSSGRLKIYTVSNANTYAYLFTSSGVQIARNDDYHGRLDFTIIRDNIAAGTYYVHLKFWSALVTGSYAFHVEFEPTATTPAARPATPATPATTTPTTTTPAATTPAATTPAATTPAATTPAAPAAPQDDHGNSISAATTVGTNSVTQGNLERSGDVDFFRIVLPNPGTLTVNTTGDIDTYGDLINSTGGIIASSDDGGIYRNFSITRHLAAGIYYVKARYITPTGTGPYALHVAFTPDAPTPAAPVGPACTMGNVPQLVGINSVTNSTLDMDEEAEYFKIEIPQGPYQSPMGSLSVYTTGTASPAGYLYDSHCRVLAINSSGGGFRINKNILGGIYYIKVERTPGEGYASRRIGDYQLHVSFARSDIEPEPEAEPEPEPEPEEGTNFDTAILVDPNSVTDVTMSMSPTEDPRYYKVEVPSRGRLAVYSSSSDTRPIGYLYDSNHRLITENTAWYSFRIDQIVSSGVYYIKVTLGQGYDREQRLRGSSGNFQLHVEFRTESGPEEGTHFTTAIPVSVNDVTDAQMSISPSNDPRYYRIQVTRVGRLTVYSSGDTKPIGYLYDSARRLKTYNNGWRGFRLSWIVSPGVYYIKTSLGRAYERQLRLQGNGNFQLHVEFR